MAKDQESARNWVRDFLVLPLMVGVVVTIVTFGLPRFFGDAKELSYVIDGPVTYLDDPAIARVKIEVNGVPISNLFAYKVRLWNSGDDALKNLPVSFVFQEAPNGFQVFNMSHVTTPAFEFGGIREETLGPSQKRCVYELLNPGDQDIVTFLTSANPDLKVFAKLEKLSVKSIQPDTQQRAWSRWVAGAIAVLASLLTSFSLKYSLERRQKKGNSAASA